MDEVPLSLKTLSNILLRTSSNAKAALFCLPFLKVLIESHISNNNYYVHAEKSYFNMLA